MGADVIVLGAGIIGVSTALQLARRGKSVVLVDRRAPGHETSFGNAGLIQREGVVPYGFPQDFRKLLKYGLNNSLDVHYHLSGLIKALPFLARYWWHSNASRHAIISKSYAPMIAHSISEHNILIEEAGAEHLIAKHGWLEIYRGERRRDHDFREAERLKREFEVEHVQLSGEQLAEEEPHLSKDFSGALKWLDPWSVRDPLALTQSYVQLFEKLGGRVVVGDALTLSQTKSGWRVLTVDGPVEGQNVVVALGPWSDIVARKLGYRFPLGVKRGYHMHYGMDPEKRLNNWLLDVDSGYLLAPMNKGIRLTTGAEFAHRDAPKTPVQVDGSERVARQVFPLGKRLDAEPWMGSRPCTPDMMPIIGPAPRHRSMWFAFGHAHHGLTLGPITGRVLAEAISGDKPTVPLDAFLPDRFNP
jgi:D-amino-acid dehydrogenase